MPGLRTGHDGPMNVGSWWDAVLERVRPGVPLTELELPGGALLAALGAGLLLVAVPPLWRLVRVGVTVVHELGHAGVGILVGRSFTGLVLRPDMSGHAVTVGRSSGPGLALTTWAGYPAPALVGLGLVLAAVGGWAAPVLLVLAVLLLVGLVRSRSAYTVAVMLVALAAAGWAWWAAPDQIQGLVLVALGVVLVLGAWRHLGAVLGRRDRGSDLAVLARLTRIPSAVWALSFVVVLAGASVVAGERLWGIVTR